jgi:hypothetical protein
MERGTRVADALAFSVRALALLSLPVWRSCSCHCSAASICALTSSIADAASSFFLRCVSAPPADPSSLDLHAAERARNAFVPAFSLPVPRVLYILSCSIARPSNKHVLRFQFILLISISVLQAVHEHASNRKRESEDWMV